MKTERNYGIDLLRLVLMYMVCVLHTLGKGGILAACPVGTNAYKVYWFLEIFAYCAVDGFAIISGYMAIDKTRKYESLVNMWFQAFFYSFIVTLLFTIVGANPVWEKRDIIKCAMPVMFRKFWYFTAFFALFFVIPVLNKFIFAVNEQTAKYAFVIVIALFSVMEFMTGPFKTQGGYSALWLMVLYCIGGLAKRGKVFEQKKTIILVIMWLLCVFVTWGVHVFLGIERLTNYVSPTILMSGLLMVILFSRIRLKGIIISKFTPLVFGIYLFQLNQVVWRQFLKDAFSFVAQVNIFIGVVYVLVFAALIFVAGLVVEFVRSAIARAIKIPELSSKIVCIANWILQKSIILLN